MSYKREEHEVREVEENFFKRSSSYCRQERLKGWLIFLCKCIICHNK